MTKIYWAPNQLNIHRPLNRITLAITYALVLSNILAPWRLYVSNSVKLRSRSQVRSRLGPRSAPGLGLYIKFGLPPPTHSPPNFTSRGLQEGVYGGLGGGLGGRLGGRNGTPKGTLEGTLEGTSNSTWKGTCCQAQVRSGPGLVQITAQIQFFRAWLWSRTCFMSISHIVNWKIILRSLFVNCNTRLQTVSESMGTSHVQMYMEFGIWKKFMLVKYMVCFALGTVSVTCQPLL